jgi:hypothetical protein
MVEETITNAVVATTVFGRIEMKRAMPLVLPRLEGWSRTTLFPNWVGRGHSFMPLEPIWCRESRRSSDAPQSVAFGVVRYW